MYIRNVIAGFLAPLLLPLSFHIQPVAQRPKASSALTYSAYVERAFQEKKKGDLRAAIADYTKAIKLKPDVAETYNGRGLAKYDAGDIRGAIADFSKAIALKPDYAEAFRNRANARFFKGDRTGAREDDARAADLERKQSPKPPPRK